MSTRSDHTRLAATLVTVGLAAVTLTSIATGAFFTATASVPNNAFATGTVALSTTPQTAVISFSNMAPGDSSTAPLTVTNSGSLRLRYTTLSTTTEDFLAARLRLEVRIGVTDCSAAGFVDGTAIYGPGILGSTLGTRLFGDPAVGQQLGDRELAPAASEQLCLRVTLPPDTDNTYQGTSTTATLRLDTEQTTNNP